MEERRDGHRRLSYLGGKIIFTNKLSTVNCVVRDISAEGFRLVIPNSISIPDEFDLEIPQKRERVRVRVTWRKLDELGVAVVYACEDENVPGDKQRVEKLKRQNAELRRRLADLDSLDP